MTRADDLTSIDDRGRRLHLLANDRPADAVAGAKELVESACRTILRLLDLPAPATTAGLNDIAASTLEALEQRSVRAVESKKSTALVRGCLQQLVAIVTALGSLPNESGSPRQARLAAGAAVTFAGFVAEAYAERAPLRPAQRRAR